MDIGSIFLILALLIPVALFIIRPLQERKSHLVSQEEHELSSLLAERDRVVSTLQELDFDFALGKVPEEEYPAQRSQLLQFGAEILRKLDASQVSPEAGSAEDRLEAAIAVRRAQLQPAPAGRKNGSSIPVPDDDLEQRIASRRRLRSEKAGGFCPKCGKPVQASDRFCPKCGASL